MRKLHTSIFINAPREKVWDVMLQDATYGIWTEKFNPGSYYVGNWDQGSEIKFLGPDPETGKESGMLSRVKESRKPEFVSLEHYGIIKDGIEDTTSEYAKKWAPAYENYTFNEKDGGTELVVDMDVEKSFLKEFQDMWERALVALKELAEK